MNLLKKISNLLIYSNIWIALAAVCCTCQTYLQIGQAIQYDTLLLLIFTATLVGYLLPRLLTLRGIPDPVKLTLWWGRQANKLRYVLVLAFLVSVILFFWQKKAVQAALLLSGSLTIFYSVPFFQYKGKSLKLREISIAKIFLIVIVWCISTVVLPILNAEITVAPLETGLLLLEKALFIFAITLPFDIRDLKYDAYNNLPTIPAIIGIPKTLYLAHFILFLWTMLSSIHYLWLQPQSGIYVALLLSYFSTAFLIHLTNTKRLDSFYTGWLDGTMILQFILVAFLT